MDFETMNSKTFRRKYKTQKIGSGTYGQVFRGANSQVFKIIHFDSLGLQGFFWRH